jgi:hypothetical protein
MGPELFVDPTLGVRLRADMSTLHFQLQCQGQSQVRGQNGLQVHTERFGRRNNVTNCQFEKCMPSDRTCYSLFSFFLLPFFPGFEELGKEYPGRLIPMPRVGDANFSLANSSVGIPRGS